MPRDPKQEFIAVKLTRGEIVDALNYRRGDDGEEYTPNLAIADDDERLTNELCQEYASEWGKIALDALPEGEDWYFESESNLANAFLLKMGYARIPEPQEDS